MQSLYKRLQFLVFSDNNSMTAPKKRRTGNPYKFHKNFIAKLGVG
jgi:hypothetical protein